MKTFQKIGVVFFYFNTRCNFNYTIVTLAERSIINSGFKFTMCLIFKDKSIGGPTIPLLFILVVDMLSVMFNHTLVLGIPLGVPLGIHEKMCYLQYTNNLLLITTRGLEDLRIFKLIIYLFKGTSGFLINFHKSYLYTIKIGTLPGG